MFDDKENLVGVLFLALCAVVGGVLIWEIVTGERLEYDGPGWLVWILLGLFIGGGLFGLFRGRIGRGFGTGPQWPDPQTGRRPWWRRWFGGDDQPRP
jgi:hypothetical protein